MFTFKKRIIQLFYFLCLFFLYFFFDDAVRMRLASVFVVIYIIYQS